MKKEIIPSLVLTVICILVFSGVYPLIVWGIAQLAPGKGEGFVIENNGKRYYKNIGQKFTDDKYFSSRPSAVDYNAAGSGGSNKGPSNPDYLAQVQARIDTYMLHNPSVKKTDISSELVTASGSGLDPDITVQGAKVQVNRIAKARGINESKVSTLIDQYTQQPFLGAFGPKKINVLLLNIALDSIK